MESYKKDAEQLRDKLAQTEQDHKTAIEEKDEAFRQHSLKSKFFQIAGEKQWAKEYQIPEVKNALLDRQWDEINSQVTLKEIGGKIQVFQKDEPEKEHFEGNKRTTFQDLIEPKLKPYLSNSGGGDNPPPQPPPSGGNGQTSAAQSEITQMRTDYN